MQNGQISRSISHAVFAVFRDEGGIVLQVESEAETPGHDSCSMRAMDGDSSLGLLLGLFNEPAPQIERRRGAGGSNRIVLLPWSD